MQAAGIIQAGAGTSSCLFLQAHMFCMCLLTVRAFDGEGGVRTRARRPCEAARRPLLRLYLWPTGRPGQAGPRQGRQGFFGMMHASSGLQSAQQYSEMRKQLSLRELNRFQFRRNRQADGVPVEKAGDAR